MDESADGSRKVGIGMLVFFGVLSLLACCGGGGFTAFVASGSESAGVTASMVSAFPAFFAISGLVGALIGHFAVKDSKAMKVAVPIGLAVLGGGCGFGGVSLFFLTIFPAL